MDNYNMAYANDIIQPIYYTVMSLIGNSNA